jgi:hypothetical protein
VRTIITTAKTSAFIGELLDGFQKRVWNRSGGPRPNLFVKSTSYGPGRRQGSNCRRSECEEIDFTTTEEMKTL